MLAGQKETEAALAAANARNTEVLRLFERVYEDNVNGKVSDEWFMRLTQKYEAEKEELKAKIYEITEKRNRLSEANTARDSFTKAVRSFMKMQKLTPTLLHVLIDRIEVRYVLRITSGTRIL